MSGRARLIGGRTSACVVTVAAALRASMSEAATATTVLILCLGCGRWGYERVWADASRPRDARSDVGTADAGLPNDASTDATLDAPDAPDTLGTLDAPDAPDAPDGTLDAPDGTLDECLPVGIDCNDNGVSDACDISTATSGDCNTNGLPDECEVEACTYGVWGGFAPSPPFGAGAAFDGVDYDGDGIAWSNPASTAVVQVFGCEDGGFEDKALELRVLPRPNDPSDGYVKSEWFLSNTESFADTSQIHSVRIRVRLDESVDSEVDWRLSLRDGTNGMEVARILFVSSASLDLTVAGFIVVQDPYGGYINTGVALELTGETPVGSPTTPCYGIAVTLDNRPEVPEDERVSVYVGGELKARIRPISLTAGRMDYFRAEPVRNGSLSDRNTVLRLDRVDRCAFAAGSSEDCNGNDAPDECDISAGTSEDTDGNRIPDEC